MAQGQGGRLKGEHDQAVREKSALQQSLAEEASARRKAEADCQSAKHQLTAASQEKTAAQQVAGQCCFSINVLHTVF